MPRSPEESKQRSRERARRWTEQNQERKNAYCRDWRKRNPEKYKAIQRRKYLKSRVKRLAAHKKWRENNREYRRLANNKYRRKNRLAAIQAYGGKCACCGEDRFEFLAIDHTNGGGNKQRKLERVDSVNLMRKLRLDGWPPGYRVLCHNCNCALGFYGHCPHQKEKEDRAPDPQSSTVTASQS